MRGPGWLIPAVAFFRELIGRHLINPASQDMLVLLCCRVSLGARPRWLLSGAFRRVRYSAIYAPDMLPRPRTPPSGFILPCLPKKAQNLIVGSSTARCRSLQPNETNVALKTVLNTKNLEALGAQRLAELLVEVSTTNAAVKRRLRLELAGSHSSGEVSKEVRKRLTTVARSRSFIDWQNRKSLIEDLEAQRRAIVNEVAETDPTEALELMWRFVAIANSVFERCDDSSGAVISVFHAACRELG
jgi:hypothetical protein